MPFSFLIAASMIFHGKSVSKGLLNPNPSPSRSGHQDVPLPMIAVKEDIQYIMIDSPTKAHPKSSLHNLIALKSTLHLDEGAMEAQNEKDLVDAINHERARNGMNLLTDDPLLTETAREHSVEMAKLDYFEHTSPTEGIRTPLDRYLRSMQAWGEGQPNVAYIGENIFFCSMSSPTFNMAYAHESLMASPGHRANILNAEFTKVGVGLYRDTEGEFWVTEMFLRDAK